jgi:putative ABC transport system ATP-binding protein
MGGGAKGAKPVLVSIEQVGLVRRDREGKGTTILADISSSARQGEITAIVGPSGGGKSSLIRLINRLDDPTAGKIFLEGEDILRIDPLELRRRVAMVLQKPFMFEGTVLANLQRPFLYRREPLPASGSDAVRDVLSLARLEPELLGRDARTLSLGQQQRVSLARALITGPQVLLLDEPTSALDRSTGDRLAATFHEISRSQRLTVILVTHDLRLAERVADYLIYLEGGRIREAGPPAELLAAPKSVELGRFLAEPAELEGEHHG